MLKKNVNQGDPTRRQALPRSLHVQAGALHHARYGPTRPGGGRLRVRLWTARLPRPLDGALLCLDRRRERALHVQNREGSARRSRHRAHWRIHSRHPCVRSLSFVPDERRLSEELSLGAQKNSSALLSHGRRRLKRSFVRLRRRDWVVGTLWVGSPANIEGPTVMNLFHLSVRRPSQPVLPSFVNFYPIRCNVTSDYRFSMSGSDMPREQFALLPERDATTDDAGEFQVIVQFAPTGSLIWSSKNTCPQGRTHNKGTHSMLNG